LIRAAMQGRLLAFDSGIGGLSIVGALRRAAPDLAIDYLADNAVYPYGELADDTLVARLGALLEGAIAELRPDAVVIACNTASTVALEAMRARFALPFVGCVPPIKWAASLSRSRTIGLLATSATVRRPYLRDLQARFAPDCRLIAHGARGLADIAELAFRGRPIDRDAIARELDGLFGQPGGAAIDAVGIGCTHYSVLLETLRALSPPGIAWLDPADAVARQAIAVLDGLARGGAATRMSERAWFTADPPDRERLVDRLAGFGFQGIEIAAAPVDAAWNVAAERHFSR
jgi:glutamate racemase